MEGMMRKVDYSQCEFRITRRPSGPKAWSYHVQYNFRNTGWKMLFERLRWGANSEAVFSTKQEAQTEIDTLKRPDVMEVVE
jgi:hypothetical protein